MLFIRASHISPRLQYSLEIIFKYVLEVPFQLMEEENNGFPLLEYGEKKDENSFSVPACGLLWEEDLRKLEIDDFMTEYGEDIFAKIFWYVTGYGRQCAPVYDRHGRYDEDAGTHHDGVVGTHYNVSLQNDWHREPMIHIWCEALWAELKAKFPDLKRGGRSYRALITYDLDHPWKYLNKGLPITLGSLFKRVVKGNWPEVKEQLAAIFRGKDPNFTFERIFRLSSPEQTLFFCLIDRKSPQDSRFTYRNKKLRTLIKELIHKGYRVGIHPSYTTFQDLNQMNHEVKQLQSITGVPVNHSRQHFLRYRLPETFRYLLDVGVKHDYTLGFYSKIGFKTGMAIPYPWFDLDKNKITELILHPTLAMDRTFQAYMKVSPEQALEEVKQLVDKVKAVNGSFTLLLHNDSLSESGEWKGWRSAVEEMIEAVLNNK
jgi:hypothetical protein